MGRGVGCGASWGVGDASWIASRPNRSLCRVTAAPECAPGLIHAEGGGEGEGVGISALSLDRPNVLGRPWSEVQGVLGGG